MAKLPYSITYNGDTPDEIKYNEQGVDVIKLGDDYIPINEATYLHFIDRSGQSTYLSITVINEDDHIGYILHGEGDGKPKPYGYVSPGQSYHYRLPIDTTLSKYIIIPFKHSIERARGVQYDRYKGTESYYKAYQISVTGIIGGKCKTIKNSAFMGICLGLDDLELEFSPNFTGTIENSAFFDCSVLQHNLNLGGTSFIGENFTLYAPDNDISRPIDLTVTTSENLTHLGKFAVGARNQTGLDKYYKVVFNLPSTYPDIITGDYPPIGFQYIYPDSVTHSITYNFSKYIDEERARLSYPGLYDSELGGFAYRIDRNTGTDFNVLAGVNYILDVQPKHIPEAVNLDIDKCSITPSDHINISADFKDILGKGEHQPIINAFILGESTLGSGAVFCDSLPYFKSRYRSNDIGSFTTPMTVHIETETPTKTLTLIFDEDNNEYPTYLSYTYINESGLPVTKTNFDMTARTTLTFDEPTKEIDLLISSWNTPNKPLVITGLYAGDLL